MRSLLVAFSSLIGLAIPAHADDFDRLDAPALAEAARGAAPREGLSVSEIGGLPNVLKGATAPLLVAETDQGGLSRMLVSPARRKAPGRPGPEVPVLVLQRFETFEPGRIGKRTARGREVVLFDGFRFDLDTGLVVPDGQGGDIQFVAEAADGPRLVALTPSKLYAPAKAPRSAAAEGGKPSPGRAVVPADFAGRYRLYADGRASGTLTLEVSARGVVAGRFRSDQTGTAYPVGGQVGGEVPHQVRFEVAYPNSRQQFEGHLWTEGKGAIAGTTTLLDRPAGFFAVRDGGKVAPEGADVGALPFDASSPGRTVVEVRPDGSYRLDGKDADLDAAGLALALKGRSDAAPEAWVLLRVPADLPYRDLARAIEVVRSAGIVSIRPAMAETGRGGE